MFFKDSAYDFRTPFFTTLLNGCSQIAYLTYQTTNGQLYDGDNKHQRHSTS